MNGQSPGRERISIDREWKFHLGDVPYDGAYWGWIKAGTSYQGGSRSKLDDSEWEIVDLPHDFVVGQDFVPPEAYFSGCGPYFFLDSTGSVCHPSTYFSGS